MQSTLDKISSLAGNTLLYGLGSIVPRALNFLLLPLHTRVFNPEDYGVVSYLYVFVAFLNVVYTFGMETAYFRYATKPGYDPQRIFNIAQTALVGISVFFSTWIILFAEPIATHLSVPGKSHYIIYLAIIMAIDSMVALPFAKLRLEKKALVFVSARVINILVLVGLNLYFFVVVHWIEAGEITLSVVPFDPETNPENSYGVRYVFFSNLIANGCYFLFFAKIFAHWKPMWNAPLFFSMIRYAYPIMLTGVGGSLNEIFSRWALGWWLPIDFYPGKNSLYAIGIFSVAYKYAIIMSLAIQAFRFAAEPFFFTHAKEKNAPLLFANINHFFMVTMSFIMLAVMTHIDMLKFLVGSKEYYEGLVAVPLLLCGYFFLGTYYTISIWFKLLDKTYYGTIITLGGSVVTISLNYFLIPYWGYLGSGVASVSCYLFMTILCYSLGQKKFPIPYPMFRSLRYFVMALLLGGLSLWLTPQLNHGAMIFNASIVVGYALIAYFMEKKRIIALL